MSQGGLVPLKARPVTTRWCPVVFLVLMHVFMTTRDYAHIYLCEHNHTYVSTHMFMTTRDYAHAFP
jgi:hypothetical protein